MAGERSSGPICGAVTKTRGVSRVERTALTHSSYERMPSDQRAPRRRHLLLREKAKVEFHEGNFEGKRGEERKGRARRKESYFEGKKRMLSMKA